MLHLDDELTVDKMTIDEFTLDTLTWYPHGNLDCSTCLKFQGRINCAENMLYRIKSSQSFDKE